MMNFLDNAPRATLPAAVSPHPMVALSDRLLAALEGTNASPEARGAVIALRDAADFMAEAAEMLAGERDGLRFETPEAALSFACAFLNHALTGTGGVIGPIPCPFTPAVAARGQ